MNGKINKIKMGRISYINASPVYYGLDHGLTPPWLALVTDVPASLNGQILSGDVQISPISAAHYAMHYEELLLLPELSISCHGPVLSVICASKYPLEELDGKKVLLSQESATGANLLKLILAQKLALVKKQIPPQYVMADLNSISTNSQQADAVMVIGDKALTLPWKDHFDHIVDLGQEWFDMTGLPFVFAVWAVNRKFAATHAPEVSKISDLLCQSKNQGYAFMDEIIAQGSKKLGLSKDLIGQYYQLLYCDMDDTKVQGMQMFFDSLFSRGLLPHKVSIRFFDRAQRSLL